MSWAWDEVSRLPDEVETSFHWSLLHLSFGKRLSGKLILKLKKSKLLQALQSESGEEEQQQQQIAVARGGKQQH